VPGYRLDRYELLCPIADGGMAQVWVARLQGKHGFEKLVAIKSILPKFASDPQFQKMFLDEARIASGIEHTNVAQIFDLGDEHGVLYLAMEWVDGDALNKLHRALDKKGEPFPPGVLCRILADACGGLHAAHELRGKNGKPLGVVHRDVSPQNILVSARGVAKLIDFGIAKARERGAGETNTGELKGKVNYMAPEQALGAAIDRRADVWAMGAILYHLLSGKPPFEGPNQLATLHALASGKSAPPLSGSVPAVVAAVVKRALTHDREGRYATAAELQAAIEAAMVSAQIATTTADVAAFVEKHIADRAVNRRDAIDMALAAAEERARMQELLKPPNPDSSISNVAGFRLGRGHVERQSVRTLALRPVSPEERLPPPPSVPTQATLGMAAVESSIGTLPMRNHRNAVIAAVGVVGVVLGVAATIALRGGSGAASPASGAAAGSIANAVPTTAPPPPSSSPSADPPLETSSPSASPSAAASSGDPTARPTPATRAASAPPRATTVATPTRKIPKVIANGF